MTWAHLLSLSRVVAGPIVAALILIRPGNVYLIAAVIFALASFTDMIDGKLARYSQSVSPLGIFLDTTADKVMVSLVLVAMAVAGLSPTWVVLVIIGREFLISGLRSFAASCNHIISAHQWGKGKAVITMAAIIIVLVAASGKTGGVLANFGPHRAWENAYIVSVWLLGVAAISTIVSGARYVVDAWPLFVEAEAEERVEHRAAAASGDR